MSHRIEAVRAVLRRDTCGCDSSVCSRCRTGGWVHISPEEMQALRAALPELERMAADADRLKEAILWANGERDEFRLREPGEGAFWWRKELMERSGMDAKRVISEHGG